MMLSETGTAERIGVKPKTLANWRSVGSGPPFYKLGSRVVYDPRDVDSWVAERKCTATTRAVTP